MHRIDAPHDHRPGSLGCLIVLAMRHPGDARDDRHHRDDDAGDQIQRDPPGDGIRHSDRPTHSTARC